MAHIRKELPIKENKVVTNYQLLEILWHLNVSQLSKDSVTTAAELRKSIKTWRSKLETLVAWATSVSKVLEQYDDKTRVDDNPFSLTQVWEHFNKNLSDTLGLLDNLSRLLAEEKLNTREIAATINKFFNQIPNFLSSFTGLGHDPKINSLLNMTYSDIKGEVTKAINGVINTYLSNELKVELDRYFNAQRAITVEEFLKLSRIEHDARLVAAEKIIAVFQKIYLLLDEYCARFSLDKELLFEMKFDFIGKDTPFYGKSFNQMCKNICNVYMTYMKSLGYPIVKEMYPFIYSVYEQRKKLIIEVKKEMTRVDQESLSLRYKAVHEYMEEMKKLTHLPDYAFFKKLSEELKSWESKCIKPKSLFDKKSTEALSSGSLAIAKKIRDNYLDLETKQHQMTAPLLEYKKHLEEHLEEHVVDSSKFVFPDKKAEETESISDVMKHYAASFLTLKDNIQLLINNIFGESSEPQAIEKQLAKYENDIKGVLDEKVYHAVFGATHHPYIDQKHSVKPDTIWLHDMASCFKIVRQSALTLNEVFNDKLTKLPASPSEGLKLPATLAVKAFSESKDLVHAINRLKKDVFVQQFFSVSGVKGFLLRLVEPLQNATLHKAVLLKAQELMPDRFHVKVFLDILNKIYSELESKYPQDHFSKEAVKKAIADLQLIVSAFEKLNENELQPATTVDYVSLVYRLFDVFSSLFVNISHAFSAIKVLSKDAGLSILQEINFILRDVFLIVDKIELTFYLKEGFLSRLLSNKFTQFNNIAEKFNEVITLLGYEFKENEIYPYSSSLLQQRELLSGQSSSSFEKSFLDDRIAKIKIEIAAKPKVIPQAVLAETGIKNAMLKKLRLAIIAGALLARPEDRLNIIALKQFYDCLVVPGCSYSKALATLLVRNKPAYELLITKERELLASIKLDDQKISSESREKMKIDYCVSSAPRFYQAPKKVMSLEDILITLEIDPKNAVKALLSINQLTEQDGKVLAMFNTFNRHTILKDTFIELVSHHSQPEQQKYIDDISQKRNALGVILNVPIVTCSIIRALRPVCMQPKRIVTAHEIQEYFHRLTRNAHKPH